MNELLDFYKNKRVFVTGHTGFKGTWLCRVLALAGAEVTGYALDPKDPSLFSLSRLGGMMTDVRGDVRDADALARAYRAASPEIVFHLAAQPLVGEGYRDPVLTYSVNVMGTVNLLECVRLGGARSVLVVTTDKVYSEGGGAHAEDDRLDGWDPYSNSKSCAELAVAAYRRSYFQDSVAVSTARAGNSLGGGDFEESRLIPHAVAKTARGEPFSVRTPGATRPFLSVLDVVRAYLTVARGQYGDPSLAGAYNAGPDRCVSVGEISGLFCAAWGDPARREEREEPPVRHEAETLALDSAKIRETFGWRPSVGIAECVADLCRFEKARISGADVPSEMDREIEEYFI